MKEEMSNKTLVNKFIDFVRDNLGIEGPLTVRLQAHRDDITTTAYYDTQNHLIGVYCKNRALVDILRSIGHEMVHHHQNQRGDLMGTEEEGADGSPFENEANAKAGELIRIYGKQNPEIYIK
jgi:hypothetical protein